MDSLRERPLSLDDMMPTIRQTLADGKTVTFTPGGTSMLPMLRPNRDSVTLSPLPQRLKRYDLPLYRRDNGQYVLHRVVKAGQTYTCLGDNQFYKEPGLRQDQMIGVVTEFIRDGKRIPVTDLRYRIYSRLWYNSRFVRRCWRKLKKILSGGKKK